MIILKLLWLFLMLNSSILVLIWRGRAYIVLNDTALLSYLATERVAQRGQPIFSGKLKAWGHKMFAVPRSTQVYERVSVNLMPPTSLQGEAEFVVWQVLNRPQTLSCLKICGLRRSSTPNMCEKTRICCWLANSLDLRCTRPLNCAAIMGRCLEKDT